MILYILIGIGLYFIYRLPYKLTFCPPIATYTSDFKSISGEKLQLIENIPVLFYSAPKETKNPFTIIYSHGNGSDIGCTDKLLFNFSKKLDANIVTYDYAGYGIRNDKSSEKEIYEDIYLIYKWLTKDLEIPSNRIILMGNSLGSGPSVDLASRLSNKLGGLILISPFTSIVRTISVIGYKNKIIYNFMKALTYLLSWIYGFDMFDNINKISNVQIPILLIHGKEDFVVPYQHSLELAQVVRSVGNNIWNIKLFEDAGHGLILFTHGQEILNSCSKFLNFINTTQ